jgi:predicted transcriptional regulator of viral defense system
MFVDSAQSTNERNRINIRGSGTDVMASIDDQAAKVVRLARKTGWVRAGDLEPAAVPRVVLTRMVAGGRLERVAHGLYRLPAIEPSQHVDLALIARQAPQVVFCLLTALQFHELTTQLPWQVWIGMPRGSHTPRIDHPPLRMVQFTGEHYGCGIEEHRREGTTLRVYGVAKTVADCFKHRNKVGLDVAIEALKDAIRHRKASFDELWRAAEVCRVAEVMRPYMETIAHR